MKIDLKKYWCPQLEVVSDMVIVKCLVNVNDMLARNNHWLRKEVPDFYRVWSMFALRPWLEKLAQTQYKNIHL
jgi:hypothetical protein